MRPRAAPSFALSAGNPVVASTVMSVESRQPRMAAGHTSAHTAWPDEDRPTDLNRSAMLETRSTSGDDRGVPNAQGPDSSAVEWPMDPPSGGAHRQRQSSVHEAAWKQLHAQQQR